MIVCDLTHAYTPTSGGIRTYINAKRQYIVEHTEHTHALIIPGEEDRITRGDRTLTIEVAAPVVPGAAPYRWFSRPQRVLRALRYASPDVIELATFYMPTELRPAFAYRRQCQPNPPILAIMAHTDFADSYVEVYMSKVIGATLGRGIGRMARRYTRAMLNRADLRIAPSPTQAEQLTRFGIDDAHVVVPGVDLDTFSPARADPAVRAEHDIPDDALFAIYVGRLDSEKRTDTMLDATRLANINRPTVLMMIGQGPHRDRLERAQSEGAPIRVLPYQSRKTELARLLASADLYLTAGPHETFGLSVVEAQACGLPVVGVDAGALVERVPLSFGRLGPVDDASAMAENLHAVSEDREAMGRAARDHVESHFSWTSTFERLFGLYANELAST